MTLEAVDFDYARAFMSGEMKKIIEQEDVKLIGYRRIRDVMRNG